MTETQEQITKLSQECGLLGQFIMVNNFEAAEELCSKILKTVQVHNNKFIDGEFRENLKAESNAKVESETSQVLDEESKSDSEKIE